MPLCYNKNAKMNTRRDWILKRNHFIGKRALCLVAALFFALSALIIVGCGKSESRNMSDDNDAAANLQRMQTQRGLIQGSESYIAAIREDGTVAFAGDPYAFFVGREWTDIKKLGTGDGCATAVKTDGTAVAADTYEYLEKRARWYAIQNSNSVALYWKDILDSFADQYENGSPVEEWRDITAISSGCLHIVGLKSDGTVVACGLNDYGQCNVQSWTDIIAISAAYNRTVGLRRDGTVVECGKTYENLDDISEWSDIIAVVTTMTYTAGLKKDGTVVCNNHHIDVSEWTDIVAISAGSGLIVGLRNDGTVVFDSINYLPELQEMSEWTDIAMIDAGGYIVGLRNDGTIVAICNNESIQLELQSWNDIRRP